MTEKREAYTVPEPPERTPVTEYRPMRPGIVNQVSVKHAVESVRAWGGTGRVVSIVVNQADREAACEAINALCWGMPVDVVGGCLRGEIWTGVRDEEA